MRCNGANTNSKLRRLLPPLRGPPPSRREANVYDTFGNRGVARHLTKKPRPMGEVAAKPTERALRTRALALSLPSFVILSEVEPEDEGAKRIHPRASEWIRARNLRTVLCDLHNTKLLFTQQSALAKPSLEIPHQCAFFGYLAEKSSTACRTHFAHTLSKTISRHSAQDDG